MNKETMGVQCSSVILGLLILLMPFFAPVQLREASAATISCSSGLSGCHFSNSAVKDGTARNVPDGRFLGSHARHSGYSTGTKRQYQYSCKECHPSASYTNAHQSGFKNITGDRLPGTSYSKNKKIANTNNPAFGNCANIYCHSTGRAPTMGQQKYSSAKWGGTEGCLGCHGGRTNGAGTPARSVGGFTLTTTHYQHLKYPAGKINCQICHAKTTVTDAWTLKPYTSAGRHVNNKRDVVFTGVVYGTYTAYKSN
jgi:predicted CxxxxCH...CXXCH cytochrome family protein